MRIISAGIPEAAVPTLRALLSSSHEVALVVTRPSARRGRRKTMYLLPVAKVATESDVELLEITTLKTSNIAQRIEDVQADLDAAVVYGGFMPPNALAVPVHGWVNLYFPNLSGWCGAAPAQWAIHEGDVATASCVFNLEEGLDTGNVHSHVEIPIGRESAGELLSSMAEAGAGQVLGVIDVLAVGSSTAIPQPSEGVTYACRLKYVDGYVSFAHDAGYEDRVIRSIIPNPGTYMVLPNGARMKLGKAALMDRDDPAPGQPEVAKKQVIVGYMNGAFVLGEMVPAGKSWMGATA